MRDRFRSSASQVDAKVNEVCTDGTVTQEEAVQVHRLLRELLHQAGAR